MTAMRSAQPIRRVIRSRRDDRYDAGRPAGPKRATAGYVTAVQDDTCTVAVLGEDLTGVVFLDDRPEVGDIVEVEARGDLLVVELVFPGPPQWLTLGPPLTKVMVKPAHTIAGDFSPSSQEYGDWIGALIRYTITRSFVMPTDVWDVSAAWDCAWAHGYQGDNNLDSVYWNTDTTDIEYHGAGVCEPLYGLHTGGAYPNAGSAFLVGGPGWFVTSYKSGWLSELTVRTDTSDVRMNFAKVKERFAALGPSAGYPVPVPPPGFTLEWEGGTNVLYDKIEMAMAEPLAEAPTNFGKIYARKFSNGDFGNKFGPGSATVQQQWTDDCCTPGGGYGPYEGGPGTWYNVTDLIEPTGWTHFLLMSDILHDRVRHWGSGQVPTGPQGVQGAGQIGGRRKSLMLAFRFIIKPRRYRFVPIEGV